MQKAVVHEEPEVRLTGWPEWNPGTLFSREAIFRRLLWTLMGVLLITYVITCFSRFFDEDEFQAMVLAVHMAEGKRLYADMWDNHGPLLSYILAHIYENWGWPGHSVMFLGRLFSLSLLPFTLFFFFRMVRELGPQPNYFPHLACFLLLFSSLFAQISVEVRSDIPLNLLWVASLYFWFRGRNRDRTALFFLSGFLLGCGFWFSFKTLVLGAAVGLMFLVDMVLKGRIMWKEVLLFGLGSALPPLAMAGALHHVGLLEPFIQSYIFQNTDRTPEFPLLGLGKLIAWDPISTPLLLCSILAGAWRLIKKQPFPRELILPLVCTWGLLLQFLFLLPTHHEQSALPMVVTASVMQAWFLLTVLPRLNTTRHAQKVLQRSPRRRTVTFVVLLLLISALLNQWPLFRSFKTIHWADRLLEEIEPEAHVLDGRGLPLFRPKISPYYSWVNTLRDRLRQGSLELDLVNLMEEKKLRYVVRDMRVNTMGEEVNGFIESNYIPSRVPLLWVAGKIIPRKDREEIPVEIRIEGLYHWHVMNSAEGKLRVNQTVAPNPVFLEKGKHFMSWGEGDGLILSTVELERLLLEEFQGQKKIVHSNFLSDSQ